MIDKYKKIRALVESAGSRMFSVCFTKKNGERRIMTCQQAVLPYRIKGKKASESAQKAVKTRAINHPNLLNVFCMHKNGIRCVNMDSLDWIQINKIRYKF